MKEKDEIVFVVCSQYKSVPLQRSSDKVVVVVCVLYCIIYTM